MYKLLPRGFLAGYHVELLWILLTSFDVPRGYIASPLHVAAFKLKGLENI